MVVRRRSEKRDEKRKCVTGQREDRRVSNASLEMGRGTSPVLVAVPGPGRAELGKRETRCHSPSSRILSALLSEIPLIVISCFLGVNATLSTVLDGTSFIGRQGQRDVLLWRDRAVANMEREGTD